MNGVTIALVLSAVVLNTAAQFVLKAGAQQLAQLGASQWIQVVLAAALSPYIIVGLTLYVVSFGIWVSVLARVEVSVAYPLLSLGYVLAAGVAYFYLNEPLTTNKMVGISLVVAGVYFLARSPAN